MKSVMLGDPIDIENYRLAKIVRFGEDVLRQTKHFFNNDGSVCCIVRGEESRSSDFPTYRVYDIMSVDREKPSAIHSEEGVTKGGQSNHTGTDDEAETVNLLCCSTGDGLVRCFTVETRQCTAVVSGHSRFVASLVAFHPKAHSQRR